METVQLPWHYLQKAGLLVLRCQVNWFNRTQQDIVVVITHMILIFPQKSLLFKVFMAWKQTFVQTSAIFKYFV